ncbi:MAG: protein kinase [Minicystis sp.]
MDPRKRFQFSPKTVIDGRYRLVREVGHGGMGVVWEAIYLPSERESHAHRFALKFVTVPKVRSIHGEDTFPREALVPFRHPYIVHVDDCFRLNPDTCVLRMELLEGETLKDRLMAHGALPLDEAATIVARAASALGSAHAHGVVHRDIKPGNLFLLREDGDRCSVKVLDFGIAKFLRRVTVPTTELTVTARGLGTPGYTAPEQLRNARMAGTAADSWSLGAVLFECLLGKRPFPQESEIDFWEACASPPPALRSSSLPRDIRELLTRMLSRSAAERPSAREVLAVLAARTRGEIASILDPALRGGVSAGPMGSQEVPTSGHERGTSPTETDVDTIYDDGRTGSPSPGDESPLATPSGLLGPLASQSYAAPGPGAGRPRGWRAISLGVAAAVGAGGIFSVAWRGKSEPPRPPDLSVDGGSMQARSVEPATAAPEPSRPPLDPSPATATGRAPTPPRSIPPALGTARQRPPPSTSALAATASPRDAGLAGDGSPTPAASFVTRASPTALVAEGPDRDLKGHSLDPSTIRLQPVSP